MGRRGHVRWRPGAAVAVASVVLAVAVPASWWGVTFVVGVLAALLAARPVVPASYAGHWTRTTLLLTLVAAVAGMAYAFEVPPWGPRRGLYLPVVLVAALAGLGSFASTPGGRRSGAAADHRHNEDAHRHALHQDPR